MFPVVVSPVKEERGVEKSCLPWTAVNAQDTAPCRALVGGKMQVFTLCFCKTS